MSAESRDLDEYIASMRAENKRLDGWTRLLMEEKLDLAAEVERLREERDKNGYTALAAQAENERLKNEHLCPWRDNYDDEVAENERLRDEVQMAALARADLLREDALKAVRIGRLREALRRVYEDTTRLVDAHDIARAALGETT